MEEQDEKKLISIFKSTFATDDIDYIRNLKREDCVKWDSLALVSMIAQISSEFSIKIEPKYFEVFNSFESIKNFIIDKS